MYSTRACRERLGELSLPPLHNRIYKCLCLRPGLSHGVCFEPRMLPLFNCCTGAAAARILSNALPLSLLHVQADRLERFDMMELLLDHGAIGGTIEVMLAFEKSDYSLASMVASNSEGQQYLIDRLVCEASGLQEDVKKLRSELAAALKQQVTIAGTCDSACCLLDLSNRAVMVHVAISECNAM